MANPYSKPTGGESFSSHPPSAKVWGELVDMLQWWKANRTRGTARPTGETYEPGIIRVKNTTGEKLLRGQVVTLKDKVFDPDKNPDDFYEHPWLQAEKPTDTNKRKFVVLREAIAKNEFGRAVASGVAACKVQRVSESHEYCEPVQSNTGYLTSCEDGRAQILWAQAGTGIRWAVVCIGVHRATGFWAKIGDPPTAAGSNRWTYPFEEVKKAGAGYGSEAWTRKQGGASGTAYNSVENPNDGEGSEGNGSIFVLPVGKDAIVWMREVKVDASTTEYWFQYENAEVDPVEGDVLIPTPYRQGYMIYFPVAHVQVLAAAAADPVSLDLRGNATEVDAVQCPGTGACLNGELQLEKKTFELPDWLTAGDAEDCANKIDFSDCFEYLNVVTGGYSQATGSGDPCAPGKLVLQRRKIWVPKTADAVDAEPTVCVPAGSSVMMMGAPMMLGGAPAGDGSRSEGEVAELMAFCAECAYADPLRGCGELLEGQSLEILWQSGSCPRGKW